MPLRSYQHQTLTNVYQSIAKGHHAIVIQQPPRTGKTVIMAEIAKRATAKHNRVLTIVHRQELTKQTQKTFVSWGVDMDYCRVGMVQTMTRHVKDLKNPQVIIIDEAHHAIAASYKRIVTAYPKAIVLMFTATPYRLSGQGMAEVADDLIPGLQVSDLIEMGFLAHMEYFAPPDINTKLLKRQRGEYTDASIDNALSKRVFGNAVDQYKLHADGLKAIAYCHSVQSAKRLAAEFNKSGISALEVDGTTPKDERSRAVQRFKNGDITVLTNVELFTEGLDLPNVDCVIQLRPTQSLSLYLQFSMRAMNPRKGKTAIILDHVENWKRFGLPTDDREWTLDQEGTNKQRAKGKIKAPAIKTCKVCFGTFYTNTVKDGKCPLCGADLPKEAPEEPKQVEGDLVKIGQKSVSERRLDRVHRLQNQSMMSELSGKSFHDLRTMNELQIYAKLRHYKPGWAYYQAKERGII
ncbi:DEAD/DEAH box helicase [Loigolactobacillus bifermentans]|uniref:Type III restriction protein res subunit n=1 Tax=Loigolactobacillus bifermentans DSM 20003 TaxID=1423726 RepID=A0A0R1H131_9LACO|nr:DEAD/DEAH box helicase [Loigolactobacillus bifermentans]KRK39976.1 type III restriction protein res subunit [Loigolactobacillus bifermentans DSM 20003]QGG59671.1 ATP-dependent helicase [Loigolactobacillus bifermentans]